MHGTELELAWAAGLTDGEGSFSVKRNRQYRYPHFSMGQAHRGVLDRLAAALGLGTVTGPYQNKGSGQYAYQAQRGADVAVVHNLLQPYLSRVKLDQASAMWATIHKERLPSVPQQP